MDLKELIFKKRIKQVDIARGLRIDPSRVSLFISGTRPLPKKYHKKLAEILGTPLEAISSHLAWENKEEA